MNINKDTKIYGSFSNEPGNFGCQFHNSGFQNLGINAIYKSFGIRSIDMALEAMLTLGISGVGISMPYKQKILKLVDQRSPECEEIGAANTVINHKGSLIAYNTDWLAAKIIIETLKNGVLYILGNGGYSKAVQYACEMSDRKFDLITRENWNDIQNLSNVSIFNCTPVEKCKIHPPESCEYIDCLINTKTGQTLSTIQASKQFKLYTGQDYPCKILNYA